LDLSGYALGTVLTTLIYALGILSLVNLLLGLIPDPSADKRSQDLDEGETNAEARKLELGSFVINSIEKMRQQFE